ncbi:ankyrin repeat domain-containing protein [Chryseolinea lacunae]|uniref:Ankyrin repeat domain-containing protein n=1 Tax=Chryseolinea lacunae TaxID=2801331 RepID=A0ABS1KUC5_9BACT|nr:ankyrin repeat domain-containing protein [Chryseolinea lacunae]MBL0742969.1 ankyrin repeat domain-containing protein [Chryseolinea lacunae]
MNELSFPLGAYLQLKDNIASIREQLDEETASWQRVRNMVAERKRFSLDEQFKAAFETLAQLDLHASAIDLRKILQSLRELVHDGASAERLGNDELGTYNLAMFIQNIPALKGKDSLDTATEIVRLSLVANADLVRQKAYAGNGGANTLEWLCMYLGAGVTSTSYLRDIDQYKCCHTLFAWVLEKNHTEDSGANVNPFTLYITCVRDSPGLKELQERAILRMICLGLSPFSDNGVYQSVSFFNRLAAIDVRWLTLLFPYESEHVSHYVRVVTKHTTPAVVKDLLNCYTSNTKYRKHFRAFFSLRPHWLLHYIVDTTPELIFNLVKRNESDLITPFLKNFKTQMTRLRDQNGNTLLHHAVLSRARVEHTVELLLNAKLSPHEKNNNGQTPAELALLHKKDNLTKRFT